jgi:protease-4
MMLSDDAPTLPNKVVLYLPLEGSFSDYQQASAYSFGPTRPHFRHYIDAIDHAQTDPRVKGMVIESRGGDLSLAQLQELRDAVRRFRASGKPTWFYAESMDEGLRSYFIASATDEIWLQPVGSVSIPGLRAEQPYARELLDKLGIEPQFFARKEFKDVFSSFAAREMPETSRVSLSQMLEDISGQLIGAMADDRGQSVDAMRAHIDQGMFTDKEALAAKLVDRVDYGDVLRKEIRLKVAGTEDLKAMKFVRVGRYINHVQGTISEKLPGQKPQVALVYAVGTIVSDDDMASSQASLMSGDIASAEDIAKAIEESIRDKAIQAIVLRIDSPGGSPTASETIRRALVNAQEKGKHVIVSMGGTAASGGYWIAAPAERIFAMPGTITGSIGVAGGKFVLSGLWNKLGVNWDDVHVGENSSIISTNEPYSAAGRARMDAIMDNIYDAFITRVAEGRKMPREQVDAVARGRVWTGESALRNGLVDELGGLNQALDYAATTLGQKSRRDVAVVELPKQKSTWELLSELLDNQAQMQASLSTQATLMQLMAPLVAEYQNGQFMARESVRVE